MGLFGIQIFGHKTICHVDYAMKKWWSLVESRTFIIPEKAYI